MNSDSGRILFPDRMLRFQQVFGATLALVSMGTVSRVITFLTEMVIASDFGASLFSDAYFATQKGETYPRKLTK